MSRPRIGRGASELTTARKAAEPARSVRRRPDPTPRRAGTDKDRADRGSGKIQSGGRSAQAAQRARRRPGHRESGRPQTPGGTRFSPKAQLARPPTRTPFVLLDGRPVDSELLYELEGLGALIRAWTA